MGISQVEVEYKPGGQGGAQDWALSASAKPGQNRNNAIKLKQAAWGARAVCPVLFGRRCYFCGDFG